MTYSGNKAGDSGRGTTTPPNPRHKYLEERASAEVYGCLLGQECHSPNAVLALSPGHP